MFESNETLSRRCVITSDGGGTPVLRRASARAMKLQLNFGQVLGKFCCGICAVEQDTLPVTTIIWRLGRMSQGLEANIPSSPPLDTKQRAKVEKKKKKRKRESKAGEAQVETSPSKKSRSHLSQHHSLTNNISQQDTSLSPFSTHRASLYLPLPPISHFHAGQGICAEYLSKLILTYYPPFRGIVLSYSNVKLSEQPEAPVNDANSAPVLAKTIDEFAASFVWVTADFLLLKAQRGAMIEGHINLQNESHIGLVCWNLFNASIERKRLPKGWKWTGPDLGKRGKRKLKKAAEPDDDMEAAPDTSEYPQEHDDHFVNENGEKIEGYVQFLIRDLDTSSSSEKERAFVSIEGTLLSDDEEAELMEKEALDESEATGSRRTN